MFGFRFRCGMWKILLHERGIEISHETVRFWWNRFGPMFAAEIRRKRVKPDARLFKLAMAPGRGFREDQWRDALSLAAVDHEGEVLESFVTSDGIAKQH